MTPPACPQNGSLRGHPSWENRDMVFAHFAITVFAKLWAAVWVFFAITGYCGICAYRANAKSERYTLTGKGKIFLPASLVSSWTGQPMGTLIWPYP